MARPALLAGHAGRLDDLAPLGDLAAVEGAELLRRCDQGSEALRGERSLHFRQAESLRRGGRHPVDDVARGARRRGQADPQPHVEPGEARFRDRRKLGQGAVARRSGRGQPAQLSVLHEIQYRRDAREHHLDLTRQQVKVMFSSIAPVLNFVKNGQLRGLATTGPTRDSALPELPTIAESGLAGFDVRLWIGLTAPAGTPRDVIDRVSAATAQALGLPEVKASLAAQGFAPLIATPEQFGAFYRSEVAKWGKVIEATGMTSQ